MRGDTSTHSQRSTLWFIIEASSRACDLRASICAALRASGTAPLVGTATARLGWGGGIASFVEAVSCYPRRG